jgi:hypothetical protein
LPAPTGPAPPPASAAASPAAPPPELDDSFGVYGCFARRLGSEGKRVGPADGFSIAGDYERRYFVTPEGLELAGGLAFFYDRFATELSDPALLDVGLSERIISQTSFALTQTAGWRLGRVRPFAKAGLGVSIAYFSSPEAMFRPGSFTAVQPLARAGAGISVVVYRDVAVSVQGMYTYPFTRPAYTTADGTTYSFLGALLDLGLGAVMQF